MKHTTQKHIDWWKQRKINWKRDYFDSWSHPHRSLLSRILKTFPWVSLVEVGCGAGANLVNIVKNFQNKQLGGIDVSEDAIQTAKENIHGALLKVGAGDDIMMSDNATDVVLTDMCLIYVSPLDIDRYLTELTRIARNKLLLCEFHSTSLWMRFKLWWTSGYYAYDWPKLLKEHGYTNIKMMKIPEEAWPGGNPQRTYGYIVMGDVPKRKVFR